MPDPPRVARPSLPFFFLVCAFVVAGSPALATAQSVTGRVSSLVGQEPVAAAVVVLNGTSHQVLTDSLGAFAFHGVRSGRYELLVQHPGFHTLRRTVTVPPNGVEGLTLPVAFRVIPLDPIRATAITPLERWRRQQASAHHVFISRQELEEYELRGAFHVGDALRRHAPNAVLIIEKTLGEKAGYPTVCIMSTRNATRPSASRPKNCAAVFMDGVRVGGRGNGVFSQALLYDLRLSDVEAIEFFPPVDALTRFGHAAENGAVFITTRRGADLAAASLLGPVQPLPDLLPEQIRHRSYLAAGTTAGFLAAFGVGYAHGLFRAGAEFCTSDCEWDVLSLAGTVLLGLGVGEVLYRLR